MPHLFVDITSHGFGHLAQVAPVLNALCDAAFGLSNLRITLRSGLSLERLKKRIHAPFVHIAATSDFGYVMQDALRIDYVASKKKYQELHADWSQRVAAEGDFLRQLAPDLVLTDVAYLPLAGAHAVGIESIAMSSLNWEDLFRHYYAQETWAAPILEQIHKAYANATAFVQLEPSMPMESLPNRIPVGPVATTATYSRTQVAQALALPLDKRWVLVGFGGFDHRLPLAAWPQHPQVHWLLPAQWHIQRNDITAIDEAKLPFSELLANVDVIIGKPGYGTFVEAACNGVPLLYLRRHDWPEQDSLIPWLHAHLPCAEIEAEQLAGLDFFAQLEKLWLTPRPPRPNANGIKAAGEIIAQKLKTHSAD